MCLTINTYERVQPTLTAVMQCVQCWQVANLLQAWLNLPTAPGVGQAPMEKGTSRWGSVRRGECACCLTIICHLQVRQLDFNIGSGIAKTLEQELVQARSEDKSLDAAVFHTWLTVSP